MNRPAFHRISFILLLFLIPTCLKAEWGHYALQLSSYSLGRYFSDADSDSGAWFAYQPYNSAQVFLQHVSASGVLLFPQDSVVVFDGSDYGGILAVFSTEDGGVWVVYGKAGIPYVQRYSREGQRLYSGLGQQLSQNTPISPDGYPYTRPHPVCSDGNNGFWYVYLTNGYSTIRLAHVSRDNELVSHDLAVAWDSNIEGINICSDGNGGTHIVWNQYLKNVLYYVHTNANGSSIGGRTLGERYLNHFHVIANKTGGAYAIAEYFDGEATIYFISSQNELITKRDINPIQQGGVSDPPCVLPSGNLFFSDVGSYTHGGSVNVGIYSPSGEIIQDHGTNTLWSKIGYPAGHPSSVCTFGIGENELPIIFLRRYREDPDGLGYSFITAQLINASGTEDLWKNTPYTMGDAQLGKYYYYYTPIHLADGSVILPITIDNQPYVLGVPSPSGGSEPTVASQPPDNGDPVVKAWPNPFNETIRFTWIDKGVSGSELEVYDLTGRLVTRMTAGMVSGTSVTWKPAEWIASGTYLVVVRQHGRILQSSSITLLR
ncbi:MAG: T9SS type A sorting domain-containing protein [bacterium]